MPQPISFRDAAARLPAHLAPPPKRARETEAQRQDRQFDVLRELCDMNMVAARDATHQIVNRENPAEPERPALPDPTLSLARATRSVAVVINLERRIAAGESAAAPANDDPRGQALRRLLYPFADKEPDPIRRRAMRLRLGEGIDDALGADLDDSLRLGDLAIAVARANGIVIDVTKLPDCYFFPISDPECLNPNARLPARPRPSYRDEADPPDR